MELGAEFEVTAQHRGEARRRRSPGASSGSRRSRTASSRASSSAEVGANPGRRWRPPRTSSPTAVFTGPPSPCPSTRRPSRPAPLVYFHNHSDSGLPVVIAARAQHPQPLALPRGGHAVPRPVVGRQPGEAAGRGVLHAAQGADVRGRRVAEGGARAARVHAQSATPSSSSPGAGAARRERPLVLTTAASASRASSSRCSSRCRSTRSPRPPGRTRTGVH